MWDLLNVRQTKMIMDAASQIAFKVYSNLSSFCCIEKMQAEILFGISVLTTEMVNAECPAPKIWIPHN